MSIYEDKWYVYILKGNFNQLSVLSEMEIRSKVLTTYENDSESCERKR